MKLEVPSNHVISCILGMNITDGCGVPTGTTLDEYTRNCYEKCMSIVRGAALLSSSCPHRPIPHSKHVDSMFPIILAMKTGWTLDTRESFVTVGNSSVHGLGVFATTDLDPGMLVTSYPVHAIVIQNKHMLTRDNMAYEEAHRLEPYQLKLCTGVDWCVTADPTVYDDHRCGHMMNDARNTTYENNVNIHMILGGVICAIMITKKVIAGAELFLDYGPGYWTNR